MGCGASAQPTPECTTDGVPLLRTDGGPDAGCAASSTLDARASARKDADDHGRAQVSLVEPFTEAEVAPRKFNSRRLWSFADGVSQVVAVYRFDPDLLWGDAWEFDERPLPMQRNCIVQVLGEDDGGEWAYGHLVEDASLVGHFPKNRTVPVNLYREDDFTTSAMLPVPIKPPSSLKRRPSPSPSLQDTPGIEDSATPQKQVIATPTASAWGGVADTGNPAGQAEDACDGLDRVVDLGNIPDQGAGIGSDPDSVVNAATAGDPVVHGGSAPDGVVDTAAAHDPGEDTAFGNAPGRSVDGGHVPGQILDVGEESDQTVDRSDVAGCVVDAGHVAGSVVADTPDPPPPPVPPRPEVFTMTGSADDLAASSDASPKVSPSQWLQSMSPQNSTATWGATTLPQESPTEWGTSMNGADGAAREGSTARTLYLQRRPSSRELGAPKSRCSSLSPRSPPPRHPGSPCPGTPPRLLALAAEPLSTS